MERNNNEETKAPKEPCCTRFGRSMRNFGRYLFNPSTHEVLGRSGLSWLKILAFYTTFYAILAGFWAACMVVFIKTLDPLQPTMQKMYSMMKDNPGVNYEPFVDSSTTLIYFTPNVTDDTYTSYISDLTDVYNLYTNHTLTDPLIPCGNGTSADFSMACRFDPSTLGNCTPAQNFGYDIGKPCVLLRINKVYRWDPNNVTFDNPNRCVNRADASDCTKQVEFLKLPAAIRTEITPGNITVSCEGENDGDADNILGVQFFPPGGFPAYFFPYYNQAGYMAPVVMAQFDVFPGRVSLIWCRIWTQNIVHDKIDLQGSIHFELFVGP